MSEIDWSKAPEWADKYGVAGPQKLRVWFNENQYVYSDDIGIPIKFGDNYAFARDRDQFTAYAGRPSTAWSGEGLPPVGTACEYFDNQGVWHPAVMSHIGSHLFIVKYQHPEEGEQEACMYISGFDGPIHSRLRPIRTPEQIAADEREAAIEELRNLLSSVACDDYHAAVAMIDAGYRKQADK